MQDTNAMSDLVYQARPRYKLRYQGQKPFIFRHIHTIAFFSFFMSVESHFLRHAAIAG